MARLARHGGGPDVLDRTRELAQVRRYGPRPDTYSSPNSMAHGTGAAMCQRTDGGRTMVAEQLGSDEERSAAEFLYDANGPIPLAELVNSFAALDANFSRNTAGNERLAVSELRSGSIIAVLVPFIPLLSQPLEVMNAANTVADFVKRVRGAINGFAGLSADSQDMPLSDPQVAQEVAELLRPLSGRAGARFGVSHVKYRSRSAKRTVEIEATYHAADIDRAVLNADRAAQATMPTPSLVQSTQQPVLIRKVKLDPQQANRGPAKAAGRTGDTGIVEAVHPKSLPVYFADSMDDLKAGMVRGAKNPLTVSYVVDLLVNRENGEPRSYTVIGLHGPARAPRKKQPPLLENLPPDAAGRPGRRRQAKPS